MSCIAIFNTIADLKLCPPMEIVNQIIGVDNPILFVTCLAKEGARVFVTAECGCAHGFRFDSGGRNCVQSSTASPGLNIVYVRPDETNRNRHTTVFIENFGVFSSLEISIQCIVRREDIFNDEELERFNFTVRYSKLS